ncbi:MAG: putative bifunctional diguanylate cyclase/phosphodiesterase [Janthinobacterium lividum]
MAVAVSLFYRRISVNAVERRCWTAIAMAFSIWALAQSLFISFMYCAEWRFESVRLDDALWMLFGLPLLLAINTTHEELDRVQWLDRAQTLLFFVVLYLLVFLTTGRLTLNHAYLIQNLALILCCLLRLPTCTLTHERQFFLRLTMFLLVYGVLETVGDVLYLRGWKAGSPVDLIWTLPVASFIALVLRDALLSKEEEKQASPILRVVGRMQGLSVAALAFLSIGVSALLTTRRPLLGGVFLAGCFALFALRTNAREDVWHKAHGRLEEAVLKDPLTGLGNRILLQTHLTRRLDNPTHHGNVVLLFADLDRFKLINDSLGHALGDQLLIEVGQRLTSAAPKSSIVCRLGGDEFVVLTFADDAAGAQASGDALLDALRLPFQLGDHLLRCTTSIGIVLAEAGAQVDHLLRTADHAMYRAKQLGKDRVQLFDASLLAQMNNRWQMEADLRQCVQRKDIDVAFQPILSVESGEISGFEALARWTHPMRGQVPPLEFIPLAEDTGLILPLGAQVLEKACQQVASWNVSWGTYFSVSVNVSPRQFADTGLLDMVLATLERTGLDPTLLRLEITESALLVHENMVQNTLARARAHGICISLDDFGTGYSSLSFLLNLPVDEVKVDRSFVSDMHRDPQRRELVRTVIQLGHSLGKRVVAEGVETEQDLNELAAMGCECAQGWLISRPLRAEALELDMPAITLRVAHKPRGLSRIVELPQSSNRDTTHHREETLCAPHTSVEVVG